MSAGFVAAVGAAVAEAFNRAALLFGEVVALGAAAGVDWCFAVCVFCAGAVGATFAAFAAAADGAALAGAETADAGASTVVVDPLFAAFTLGSAVGTGAGVIAGAGAGGLTTAEVAGFDFAPWISSLTREYSHCTVF